MPNDKLKLIGRHQLSGTKAIMLAAGSGVRQGRKGTELCPKVLLRFGGKSLLQRHIEMLKRAGTAELVLGVGFQHDKITQEIAALGAEKFVRTVCNNDYESGNIVTLWALRDEFFGDKPVLLMDGDLLYDGHIVQRLISSPNENCILLDRSSEPGAEQVKCCVRNDEIIEFRRWLSAKGDFHAESVGMVKLSPRIARKLMSQTKLYIEQARRTDSYEEAIRDVMLTSQGGTFGYEDITGLPWIDIDFAEDIERATREILPRLGIADSKEPRVVRTEPQLKIVK